MNDIQTLVFPNLEFNATFDMYVRTSANGPRVSLQENIIHFQAGSIASFDTFFNGFTVHIWKNQCIVDDLYLKLDGDGQFILRFGLHRIGHAHRWLQEDIIDITADQPAVILVKDWGKLDGGILYASVQALTDGVITGGAFMTSTAPQHDVKLGIVITHFNRKSYVIPAIRRIRADLLETPQFKDKISLIVVDNSQNITPEECQGATVIKNQNLGGSGGFMRGLLYLKDQRDYTHCLFMDDDASCEIESIRRSWALLSYANDERSAIAGCLLREIEPFRLIEKGAKFDGLCRPLKSGLDIRHINDLLVAEANTTTPDYGGWWFFCFPVKFANELAFPFFVRGDDSRFSMGNNFRIITANGICSWGDDFHFKNNSLTTYFDLRCHIVNSMQYPINFNAPRQLKIILRFFLRNLLSYNYASASACTIAIKHVTQGPSFFIDNMDTSAIRAEISMLIPSDRLIPINRADFEPHYVMKEHESRLRRYFRWVTINGFLLPDFALKNKFVFQHKGYHGTLRQIFLYKKILYEYEPLNLGYVAEYDRKRFFSELWSFSIEIALFIIKYKKIKKQFQKYLPHMTSEDFWRSIYHRYTK